MFKPYPRLCYFSVYSTLKIMPVYLRWITQVKELFLRNFYGSNELIKLHHVWFKSQPFFDGKVEGKYNNLLIVKAAQ